MPEKLRNWQTAKIKPKYESSVMVQLRTFQKQGN